MYEVDLDGLILILQREPAIVEAAPVSLLCLQHLLGDRLLQFASAADLVAVLDDPSPCAPKLMLAASPDSRFAGRFPTVRLSHDPFGEVARTLDHVMAARFGDLASAMLTHVQIGSRLEAEARAVHLIVLLLLDGLSYGDAVAFWGPAPRVGQHSAVLEPCLVSGPTLTAHGFKAIVGEPPIARRLYRAGFPILLGMSYWEPDDNALSDYIFRTIRNVRQARSWDDVSDGIAVAASAVSRGGDPTYIQVVRMALDQYAHQHHERPPVEHLCKQLLAEIRELADVVGSYGLAARIFATSDHGIAWAWQHEWSVLPPVPQAPPARHTRHYDSTEPGRHGISFGDPPACLWCLPDHQIRRPLRTNEQGVHGGVSREESIVPFLSVAI